MAGNEMLKSFRDRIVRLETERRSIAEDIKDVYAEMKSSGLSPAAMRRVIKEIFETPEATAKRAAVEEMADIYKANLGMLGGTPLGEAARRHLSKLPPKGEQNDDEDESETLPHEPAPEPAPKGPDEGEGE